MTRADFADKYGFGQHAVTVVEHFWISMTDGVRLAAKAWFPSAQVDPSWFPDTRLDQFYVPESPGTSARYPVILEYLPYGKTTLTAMRDYRRLPWLASQGYVVLRVDMRGTGESEGLYYGEYLPQEQQDCVEVIKWAAAQVWCTAKVGMIGKSWGGFNGLQVAYCQPPELQAVVSIYSTDDRYTTDIHYLGGCVSDGLLGWASAMLMLNARCPDPRLVSNWKEMWRERLNNTQPWCEEWLRRQMYDEFWAHGSVCEDYSKVQCPVLLIGGWRDGYRDAVFRMVNKLPNCKAIIGPWPHEWPDTALPGPNIEYLRVVQQWFDQHLKGVDTQALDEPKFRLYLQSHSTPGPSPLQHGRWIQMEGWPSPQVEWEQLSAQGSQLKPPGAADSPASTWEQVPFSLLVGMNQGLWLQFDEKQSSPDQRLSDAYSLVYTSPPLTEERSLVGMAEVQCEVKVTNHHQGVLAVRLVDQFPTGESTLVTYGALNLTHARGHTADKVRDLVAGEEIKVRLELGATSYVFPPGHKLKLCLSSAYWPLCWPSSKCVDMYVSRLTLNLPLVPSPKPYTSPWFNVTSPKLGPDMETRPLEEVEGGIRLEMDFPGRRYKRTVDVGLMMPRTHLEPLGVTMGNRMAEVAEVEEGRPDSAKLSVEYHYTQEYPDIQGHGLTTRVDTHSVMWADQTHFHLTNKLTTTLDGQIFFEKEWKSSIARLYV